MSPASFRGHFILPPSTEICKNSALKKRNQPQLPGSGFDEALFTYITRKVSYTVIWEPPCKTGHILAISTAASSESAVIMEYPLAIVPTGLLLTAPLLAMLFAVGVNGLPMSATALPRLPYQAPQAFKTTACS